MRLIDADTLRDALGITGAKETCKGCQYNKRFNFACNTDDAPSFAYVCEAIDDAPTIDAVPVRHGKWVPKYIRIGGQDLVSGMKCSECGEDPLNAEGDEFLTDYCPNCGARMDEE